MPGTRKLGRATDSRNAMLRAMVTYLFENGKIETTVPRAKEVRAMAEKMVTLGKRDELHAKTDPLQKNAGQYAGNGASARHFLRLPWA